MKDRSQDSHEVLLKRLRKVKDELKAASNYDYVVVNEQLDEALGQMRAVITAERSKYEQNHHLIDKLLDEAIPVL